MGNEISQNVSDLDNMKKYAGYSPKQVELIKERFEMLCDEDLTLDKEKFMKLMKTSIDETNRLFEFFDTDGSGKLDSYEFICGLALLSQATLAQKAEIIFNLYDFDHSKLISEDELVVLLKTVWSSLNAMCKKPEITIQQAELKAKDILSKYDTNKDREISLREFQSFVSKDPEILRLLYAFNLITYDDLRVDFGGGEDELIPEVDSDLEIEINKRKIETITNRTERIKLGIEHIEVSKNDDFFEEDFYKGDQFQAVKPWLGTVKNSQPSDYKYKSGESNPPETSLQLEYVYGIRCHDTRNNLKYASNGDIVYHTAAVGIVLDSKKNSQSFFMEHNDDILCIDVYDNLCITGQIGVNPLICVWDLKTLQSRLSLKGVLQKGVNFVCFSNDGKKFAASGLDNDHCIVIYDLEKAINNKQNPISQKKNDQSGLLISTKSTKSEILDIKFDLTDKILVIACIKEILFLNYEGGVSRISKGLWEHNIPQAILCIGFIETNVITGMFKGDLLVWKGNRASNTIKAHIGAVNALCMRKSAKGIITGGNDGMVITWDSNLKKVSSFLINNEPNLRILQCKIRSLYEYNNNILIGTRSSEIIEYINGKAPTVIMRGHYNGELWGLTTHPNSHQFYTVGEDNLLCNWDIQTHKQKNSIKLDSPAKCVDISGDSKYLAVGCLNGNVLIIESKNLSIITTLKDRQSEVSVIKFSPLNGQYLAIAYGPPDNEIIIYNIKSNFKILNKIKGSASRITHIDFSEDSSKLQMNNTSYEISYYDVKTCKREPNGASLHKDEKWATWTCILGWPVQGIWPPCSNGTDINNVDRTSNMDILATGDDFGKVKLFKYPVARERAGFNQYGGHSAHVTNVRFTFKNEYLISIGGGEKSIFQWKFNVDKPGIEESNLVYEGDIEEDAKENDLFEEEEIEDGDQFMAVKPFKGELINSIPSWYKPSKNDNDIPNGNLTLKYVHGYRCFDAYDSAKYGKKGEIIFIQAALGVVLDNKTKVDQTFFQMHEEDIISLAIHPKLNIVATGQMAAKGKAKTVDIFVWDVETKSILANLNNFHLRAVNQLSFSPDGSKLLSIGQDDDNSLAIYDWQGKILLCTAKVDKAKVTSCSWRSETQFITCGPKHVKFWSLNGRNIVGKRGVIGNANQKFEAMVSSTYCFNNYSVTGSKTGNIYVWIGESIGKITKGHNGEVGVLYSYKQTLYSGGEDGVVILWAFGGQGALTKTIQIVDMSAISKYKAGIRTIDIKSDGNLLIGTRGAELYEGKPGGNWSVLLQGHYDGEVWGCAFSPGNYRFVTCGGDKTIRLWDVQTKKMLLGSDPFETDIRAVDWSSNGKFIIVGDLKAKIYMLDSNTLQVQSFLQSNFKEGAHGGAKGSNKQTDPWIEDIKISPNSSLVAFGAHGGASVIELMSINNNKLIPKGIIKAGLTSALTHLDFSSDGDYLIVNSQAYELKFCSVASMKNVSSSSSRDIEWFTWTCTLGFYSQGIFPSGADGTDVNAVCRSNNKKIIATGDDFGKVKLFKCPSVVEKSLFKSFPGHSSHVTKVKFSFDDCFLVSTGGNDKAVILWQTDFGAGDQNQKAEAIEDYNDEKDDEQSDFVEYLQPKTKKFGADKFKQYKEGFQSADQLKKEKKGEDEIFGEEEDKGDEMMAIQPWLGAIKEPKNYLKPPLNQEKAPSISLELTYAHGYRVKDCRNNLKYLKNGNIVFHAAGLGIVMDIQTNKQTFFNLHTDDITAIALHPDGCIVATGEIGSKPFIYVWDSNTLQKLCSFRGILTKGINKLAFNNTGDKLVGASIDVDHTIAIYDVKVSNGALIATCQTGKSIIMDIGFRNDNDIVIIGSLFSVWSINNKNFTSKTGIIPKEACRKLVCLAFNEDQTLVGDLSGGLQIWKGEDCLTPIKKLHEKSLDVISVHQNYIVTGGSDFFIRILDKSYQILINFSIDQIIKGSLCPEVRGVCLSSDYKRILIGTYGAEIYELSTKDNKITLNTKFSTPKEIIKGHYTPNKEYTNEIWGLAVFPDGDNYCTTSDDGTLRIWSTLQKKLIKCIKTNLDSQGKEIPLNPKNQDVQDSCKGRAVDVSPDGKLIAVGFKEGTLKIYESDTLDQVANLKCGKEWISDIKFSPDNKSLAVGSHDNAIYVYQLPDFKKKISLRKHSSFITHIDWSEDSLALHSNCGAYELLYWDVATQKQITNGATIFRDQPWATWTAVLGWPVQGIWPPNADGTDINSVDRSHFKHPGGYELIACGDDFGKIRVLRYPSIKKGSSYVLGVGHSSHVTGVKWNKNDEWLYSIGGEDNCVFQWKKIVEK